MNGEKEKKKKIILIILIMCTIIGAGIIFSAYYFQNGNGNLASQEETDTIYGDESLGIDSNVDKKLKDYRNIFIFGLDNMHRSDIILLASIDKKTNQTKLITIHRDTYMQLREEGETYYIGGREREFFKCNHAYKKGGFYAAMKEFNMNMDLNCHEGIGLDWSLIAIIIDGVGGIEVDVTDTMFLLIGGGSDDSAITHTGVQTLNGRQAIKYLRVRKDATAVQRAERNEAVFKQVFEKVNNLNKKEQLDLLDIIYSRADSNMSKNTMTNILNQLSSFELETEGGWPIDWHLYWDDDWGFYYFLPETLESNVVKLHSIMFSQDNYQASYTVKKISNRIDDIKVKLNKDDRDDFGQ